MSQRPYAQNCALATALDVIGDRWALLVVRELLLGPKRFTDLVMGLPGGGTNTLAARLKELEGDGVITRRWLPPPAATTVYELTARGRGLEPIVLALVRWGAPLVGRVPIEHPIRAGWIGVAMLAFVRPGATVPGVFELDLPTGMLTATVAEGALSVRDGAAPTAAIRVHTTEPVLLGILRAPNTLPAEIATGVITIDGDGAAFAALMQACAIGAP